jgi:hypothetical protein
MASLVAPLVTGFPAAASGSVEFLSRSTSSLSSQVYSDPDGQFPVTTHSLDADGSITRYVTEIVDVVVRNASGATVRQWTEQVDGRTVRLESTAFTGSNPNGNGQTIAGGRTTLHAGWALYRESQGADDGYVNINGVEYLIKTALGSAGAVYFNVKTGYGAQGNGTADDTSSIQAAINAAQNAGGGIVFFPPGTYKITGSLTITSNGVSLLGASRQVCTIRQTVNTTTWLSISAEGCSVGGLTIDCSPTTITGAAIRLGNLTNVESCRIRSGAGACFEFPSLTQVASVTGTFIEIRNASGTWASNGSANYPVNFNGCYFFTQTVPSGAAIQASVALMGGKVEGPAGGAMTVFGGSINVSASGTLFWSNAGASVMTIVGGGNARLIGCEFDDTSGAVAISGANSAGVQESGCRIGAGGFGALLFGASVTAAGSTTSTSRAMRSRHQGSVSGTTFTPGLAEYGVDSFDHTSGASMAIGNPTVTYNVVGARFTLVYENNTGGARTPTWGSEFFGVPATAVNNGAIAVYDFVNAKANAANTNRWICVTTNPVVTAT